MLAILATLGAAVTIYLYFSNNGFGYGYSK